MAGQHNPSRGHPADSLSYLRPSQTRIPKITPLISFLSTLLLLSSAASAALIEFQNCLQDSIIHSRPLALQFTPYYVDAKWDHRSEFNLLTMTIYGNVSGSNSGNPLPPPSSKEWHEPEYHNGKILNLSLKSDPPIITTLYSSYDLLTYNLDNADRLVFCDQVLNQGCPISPVFNSSPADRSALPSFYVIEKFWDSYAFTSISSTVIVKSGDPGAPVLACISAPIVPDLGDVIRNILTFIPLLVLVFVAVATVLAATASPWGTTDFFNWTSNYGRDDQLLRLVTPGFGDCLQYLQFIVLSGGLNLDYPGFFQPVISRLSWAALIFNESFVSHGNGSHALEDGLYATHGEYGLTRIRQLVGISTDYDLWAGTIIWLLVIIIFVVALCQVGFFFRWSVRKVAKTHAEDLRTKNWPFAGGNIVRIVCNFFLLPIVSLSMFQLVIAARSPAVVVAFAVILLAAILAFGAWTLYFIFQTKPRSRLFDDLPTVLLYGPLYNTYSDEAAPFALIPALLTFVRGVAIGAIQPSGIAQLVVLAICEIILVLTLHAFRPFHSPTSMNAFHTLFASLRLIVVLLMVAFVPTLGVTEGPKGWVGYVILLLHALLLVFGFLLNAIQRIIEVAARLAGVGGDKAATRQNKAFGVRQLSRRKPRPADYRFSQHSGAIMMGDDPESKSIQYGARSRSISASSGNLLNSHQAADPQSSPYMDRSGSGGTPMTEMKSEAFPHSILANGSVPYSLLANGSSSTNPAKKPQLGIKTGEAIDPYYRPPRQRRPTGELMTPGAKSRGSADWTNGVAEETDNQVNRSQQGLPHAAYLRQHGDSDPNLHDPRRSNVDYAVREVDYYYGVRGPALSSQPTRKLKTGPADPVGPVSSATGWFKGLFSRQKRDSGKGFEVVRSSRAPPPGFDDDPSPKLPEEPYHDNPSGQIDAYLPGERTRSNTGDTEPPDDEDDRDEISPVGSEESSEDEGGVARPISDVPPSLAPIENVGGLDLPSRFNSGKSGKTSRRSSRRKEKSEEAAQTPPPPAKKHRIPRRSVPQSAEASRLSPVMDEGESRRDSQAISSRIPFSGPDDPRRPSVGAESALDFYDEVARDMRNSHSMTSSTGQGAGQPTSYGRVIQHRASDRLRQSTIGRSETPGTSAEVVESMTPRLSRDFHTPPSS